MERTWQKLIVNYCKSMVSVGPVTEKIGEEECLRDREKSLLIDPLPTENVHMVLHLSSRTFSHQHMLFIEHACQVLSIYVLLGGW